MSANFNWEFVVKDCGGDLKAIGRRVKRGFQEVAAKARKKEREACARSIEPVVLEIKKDEGTWPVGRELAKQIRARGDWKKKGARK